MAEDVLTRARDAGYTAVGFGVLAVQKLQVKRREVTKDVARRIGGKDGVRAAAKRVDAAVDPVLDGVEKRLPPAARTTFHRARQAGRAVERIVLS